LDSAEHQEREHDTNNRGKKIGQPALLDQNYPSKTLLKTKGGEQRASNVKRKV